ncbi:MAG: DUF1156 domain-containing protein [Verrucomicrobiae bacterium]|nr:DUF1156 domain-containing protein [Verrucomicrobiae bacterium]
MSDLTFIESQFPVSRLSKESYKERKANYSQTLTGLGKWWGRKPLVLVRATILGLLMPASDDPERDREIFLKIMTMDGEGLLARFKGIAPKKVYEEFATAAERDEWDKAEAAWRDENDKDKKRDFAAAFKEAKERITRDAFLRLSYEQQLEFCERPEQIPGPSEDAWKEINAHLGTDAADLPGLVRQLGQKRFGRVPRVGDAFCGGGSVPFEAARIGCEAYGSDLNPVAALLTWAALNIVGGGEKVAAEVRAAQQEIYDAVDAQVTAWGIEHKTEDLAPGVWEKLTARLAKGEITPADIAEKCWRADAYLYCVEVTCPETGWRVPLAPSWVIGEKSKCVAMLVPDHENQRYTIEIHSGVDAATMKAAKNGTVRKGYVIHPILEEQGKDPASIEQIRLLGRGQDPDKNAIYHESGLRLWKNADLVPRPTDVFGERLYCVRWVETYRNRKGDLRSRKLYRGVTKADETREAEALSLVRERFDEWQRCGFLPTMPIEPGAKTSEPIRTRGWTHWHHLFNAKQLLVHGLFASQAKIEQSTKEQTGALLLALGRLADWDSKLTRWDSSAANEKVAQTFSNQALNTLVTYAGKGLEPLGNSFFIKFEANVLNKESRAETFDARCLTHRVHVWVTDPPYADAVNYHELSEYPLAWQQELQTKLFPEWYADSRRALAVTGSDENFRRSMVDCYKNLAEHMPDNGLQVVMFTHQDAGVWADLALILWASGLRVTGAWCIVTETDSALKAGNYVQGTVLLVLRKQTTDEVAFLDEIYPEVEAEVVRQLEAMQELDDTHAGSPDFGDTDYQLAAYAAALRVLTKYKSIEDIDIAYELSKPRQKGKGKAGEKSPIEAVIDQAVKIACDHLVPRGFDTFVWKTLTPAERFYLKGLDLETHGEFRAGAYQELARGFGLREYTPLLGNAKANEVRLKTATAFAKKQLGGEADPFANTLTRHLLFAIRETTAAEGDTAPGKSWLRSEIPTYWADRKTLLEILRYLQRLEVTLPHWKEDAKSARLLAGAVENDHA